MPTSIAPTAAQRRELGDELLRDLMTPDARAAAFASRDGYARVAPVPSPGGAGLSGIRRRWTVGYSPGVATIGVGAATELLMQCLAHVSDHGGGEVTLWRQGVRPDDDRVADNVGLEPDRDLLQMRIDLAPTLDDAGPDPDPHSDRGADSVDAERSESNDDRVDDSSEESIRVRAYRIGDDDRAWLALNNAAFADHHEQGGWTLERLRARQREPWFDASWFLVAIDLHTDTMVGFNWLRRHPAGGGDPEMGEIYAIGVDPAAHGRGLGRRLARAGFDRIVADGVSTGLLYVAADNAVARALYESLGFTVTRTDRAYTATVVTP